jgi:hypothetical protein
VSFCSKSVFVIFVSFCKKFVFLLFVPKSALYLSAGPALLTVTLSGMILIRTANLVSVEN